eukprot:COSAG04_NODE_9471_length_861_cov_0.961942_1_plen_74_part_10
MHNIYTYYYIKYILIAFYSVKSLPGLGCIGHAITTHKKKAKKLTVRLLFCECVISAGKWIKREGGHDLPLKWI